MTLRQQLISGFFFYGKQENSVRFLHADQCEKTAKGLKSRNTAVHNFHFLTSTCHGEEKSQITPFKWKQCQHIALRLWDIQIFGVYQATINVREQRQSMKQQRL